MSSFKCCFLTCIQVSQEAGKVIWNFHLLKNFSQFAVIHIVKDFSIINEAVDVLLEFCYFFLWSNRFWQLDLWFLCLFSIQLVYLVHVLLKPSLKDFDHYLASMWNEHNYEAVWTLLGTAFLWDYNENWPFLVLWLLLSFPNLLAENQRYQENISCKDGHNEGQKW